MSKGDDICRTCGHRKDWHLSSAGIDKGCHVRTKRVTDDGFLQSNIPSCACLKYVAPRASVPAHIIIDFHDTLWYEHGDAVKLFEKHYDELAEYFRENS